MVLWTLCEVVSGRRLLLKLATRGISIGKWNGLGGKIEKGESPEESAVREVKEESGIVPSGIERWGRIDFYRGSRARKFGDAYLFVVDKFSGVPSSGEEGEVRWFQYEKIPYERMWDDDKYWLPLLLQGYRFSMEFVYDARMEKVNEVRLTHIAKGRPPGH